MLHHEDIKNLSELESTFVDKHDELPFYLNFLRMYGLNRTREKTKQFGNTMLSKEAFTFLDGLIL